MKALGIVPARAGSKRLPGKNLATIGGRSLVRIAAQCGLAVLDHVVVSTEDEDVWLSACVGTEDPRLTWRQRPAHLATDAADSMGVVRDVVQNTNLDWDAVVLLQPTSPLRLPEDVGACLMLLVANKAEAVVTVTDQVGKDWLFELGHANRLRPVSVRDGLCVPNGAVFALTRQAYEAGYDWWTAPLVYGHVMPKSRSIDIDTADDLAMARALAAVPA